MQPKIQNGDNTRTHRWKERWRKEPCTFNKVLLSLAKERYRDMYNMDHEDLIQEQRES